MVFDAAAAAAGSESATNSLARLGVLRKSLVSMRRASQEARLSRVEAARAIVERALERNERSRSRCESRRVARVAASERSLSELVLRYRSILSAEQAAVSRKIAEADAKARVEIAELETRTRLATFGAHVDQETKGRVKLRRLDPEDPQNVRCRRAATENARRGTKIPDVRDVYRIENRVLLETFVGLSRNHKVKGLFTSLPSSSSLERIATLGFRREDDDDEDLGNLFDDDGGQGVVGPARQAVTTKTERVQFPRVFSKYSTTMTTTSDDDDVLILCRVLVGNVVFDGAREDSSDDKIDSLYTPQSEEYKPLHPEKVLPEFILICRHHPDFVEKDHRHHYHKKMFLSPSSSSSSAQSSHFDRSLLFRAPTTLDDDDVSKRAMKHRDLIDEVKRSDGRRSHRSALSSPVNPSCDDEALLATTLENEAWDHVLQNACAEKRAIVRALSDLVDAALLGGGGGGNGGEKRGTRPPSRTNRKDSAAGTLLSSSFPKNATAGTRRQGPAGGGARRVVVASH